MSESTFSVTIISPEKQIYAGSAEHLLIPGSDGYFGVMANHASLVAELDYGILEVKLNGNTTKIVIDAGFAEIKSNTVKILTNGGDLQKNIDIDKAKKELELALASTSKHRNEEIKKAKFRVEIHKN